MGLFLPDFSDQSSTMSKTRRRPGSSVVMFLMAMVVLANIGSILEVVETLVDNIIIASTSTNTIRDISERSVCVTSTFMQTPKTSTVLQSTWTSCGLSCLNKLASSMRRT